MLKVLETSRRLYWRNSATPWLGPPLRRTAMSPARATAWCRPGPGGQSASRSVMIMMMKMMMMTMMSEQVSGPGCRMSCPRLGNSKIMPRRLFMVNKYSLNRSHSPSSVTAYDSNYAATQSEVLHHQMLVICNVDPNNQGFDQ